MDKDKTFGEKIKELRKFHKMTLKTFAEKMSVHYTTLGDYEKNLYLPRENTIKIICQAFGVTKEWLVDGIGEMYPDNPPMPDTEEKRKIIAEAEKIKPILAEQLGITMPVLNELIKMSEKGDKNLETFVKAMTGDDEAKKELMSKLWSK